jgi:hypothetical protein
MNDIDAKTWTLNKGNFMDLEIKLNNTHTILTTYSKEDTIEKILSDNHDFLVSLDTTITNKKTVTFRCYYMKEDTSKIYLAGKFILSSHNDKQPNNCLKEIHIENISSDAATINFR